MITPPLCEGEGSTISGGEGGKEFSGSLITPERASLEEGFSNTFFRKPHRVGAPWIFENFRRLSRETFFSSGSPKPRGNFFPPGALAPNPRIPGPSLKIPHLLVFGGPFSIPLRFWDLLIKPLTFFGLIIFHTSFKVTWAFGPFPNFFSIQLLLHFSGLLLSHFFRFDLNKKLPKKRVIQTVLHKPKIFLIIWLTT